MLLTFLTNTEGAFLRYDKNQKGAAYSLRLFGKEGYEKKYVKPKKAKEKSIFVPFDGNRLHHGFLSEFSYFGKAFHGKIKAGNDNHAG